MLQWVLYMLVVSAVLSAAAWLAECALQRRHLQSRWAWIGAIGITLLMAYVSGAALTMSRGAHPALLSHAWQTVQHSALIQLTPLAKPATATATAYRAVIRTDMTVAALWLLLSALTLLWLGFIAVRTFLRRHSWPLKMVGSHCVGVTTDVGPAIVGLIRPTIALPQWVLSRTALELTLILAHEHSHLKARDPLLLTTALVAVFLLPWNIPLWWQLHRLRHAIEVDCDSRVLRDGHDARAYGEALIEVGQRRSGLVGPVAAMAESRTLLEKRIEIMSQRSRKPWTIGSAILSLLALAMTTTATLIAAPDNAGSRPEITVDSATLDRYAGKYQLGPTTILTVTREDSALQAQISGQPKLPIYAETPTKFFWKVVDAQVVFTAGNEGPASSATIHQNGVDVVAPRMQGVAAQDVEQQLADRVRLQQPQPGTEAALRKHIGSMLAGMPNYEDMSPTLQTLARRQRPVLDDFLNKLGPVQSIEFRGVADSGVDKYLVTHASGKKSQWLIGLDTEGKTSTLGVLPSF